MVSKKKTPVPLNWLYQAYLQYIHHHVQFLNSSKIFAGLVVITLNISSKFVSIKLSKSMESYLKHTFSRDILIFCIVWMGSRDIYIALAVTVVFIICMDYLFNENSVLCILPESFTNHHIDLLENQPPSPDEIQNAKQVLQRAGAETKKKGELDETNDSSTNLGSVAADSAAASLIMKW